MAPEQTVVLLKPDAVQRNLVGTILSRFEVHGFDIIEITSTVPDDDLLDNHYREHTEQDWYSGLREYMQRGLVIAILCERANAVAKARQLIGHTEPVSAERGTIRGDLGYDSYAEADAEGRGLQNLVHASEDTEGAARERDLWF